MIYHVTLDERPLIHPCTLDDDDIYLGIAATPTTYGISDAQNNTLSIDGATTGSCGEEYDR